VLAAVVATVVVAMAIPGLQGLVLAVPVQQLEEPQGDVSMSVFSCYFSRVITLFIFFKFFHMYLFCAPIFSPLNLNINFCASDWKKIATIKRAPEILLTTQV